jgi:hypothetical protein
LGLTSGTGSTSGTASASGVTGFETITGSAVETAVDSSGAGFGFGLRLEEFDLPPAFG